MVDTGAFATLLHRGFVPGCMCLFIETPLAHLPSNLKQRAWKIARIRRLSVGSVDIVGKDVGVIDLEGLIHSDLLRGLSRSPGLLVQRFCEAITGSSTLEHGRL